MSKLKTKQDVIERYWTDYIDIVCGLKIIKIFLSFTKNLQ